MKWFRMYSDALHNPKVQKLHPTTFKHWVNLLCLASENEPRGVLPSVEEIAFTLRVKPAEAQRVIDTLTKSELLDTSDDGRLSIHNWTSHQREFDDGSTRVRRHRSNRKNSSIETKEVAAVGNVTDTLLKRAVDTEEETDTDSDTDSEKEQRVIQSIESFTVTEELRMWAQLNTPHVDIAALTARWQKAVRDHNYRNANGLVEDAAESWKRAMLDAQQKEDNRERTAKPTEPVGLATRHGMRSIEDRRRELEGGLRQVQPTVTAGAIGPMLSVRSNG